MKFKYLKSSSILMIALFITATGCLKDKALDSGEIQSVHGSGISVISIGLNVNSATNFAQIAYDNSNTDTVVDLVPVELGGPSAASQDIHVTLVQVDSLVDNFNDSNGTDYIVPTKFSIVNPVVVIAKGSRTGFLQIKFVPSDLIGTDYAIGFAIQGITEQGYTISGNLSTGVVAVVIKNKYDGLYSMDIETIGWAAYSISDGMPGAWPNAVNFITTGTGSNILSTAPGGTGQAAFTNTGAATSFGATKPQYSFDLTTNALTGVTNLLPDDGRGRAFHLNSAVTDSRYDPATKTIYAAYIMTQNGRPDQEIYDTLVYTGPR